jgi:hypothetical protein
MSVATTMSNGTPGISRTRANADGLLEGEAALVNAFPGRGLRKLDVADYFGPAGALEWTEQRVQGAADSRFPDACAMVA